MPAPCRALATSVRAQKCGMVMSVTTQIIFPYMSDARAPAMDVHMTPQDAGMARSFWLILSALLIGVNGYSAGSRSAGACRTGADTSDTSGRNHNCGHLLLGDRLATTPQPARPGGAGHRWPPDAVRACAEAKRTARPLSIGRAADQGDSCMQHTDAMPAKATQWIYLALRLLKQWLQNAL